MYVFIALIWNYLNKPSYHLRFFLARTPLLMASPIRWTLIQTELTSILDEVAPLKTGHRTGPRKAKNWLSPEAVDAKKQRRRLERRWKASNAEPDRLAYRLLARLQTS